MKSERSVLSVSGVWQLSLPLVAVALLYAGCDSSGTHSKVSSTTFFAPVPLAVDPVSGTNAQGEARVEVLVDKVDILRLINPDRLDSELQDEDARTIVLGVLNGSNYVLFEQNSGSILEYNIQTDELRLSLDRITLAQRFNTTKVQFAATTTAMDGEWIFGFESSRRSLFVMRSVPGGGGTHELRVDVLANINTIRRQLRESAINFIKTFEIGRRTEVNSQNETVRTSEIVVMASPPGGAGGQEGLQAVHLYVLTETDGVVAGTFRVFDEDGTPYFGFDDGHPTNPKPVIPLNSDIPILDPDGDPIDFFGLVNYDDIRLVTQSNAIDIFDFRPVSLRDPVDPTEELASPRFWLLYERSSATFILVENIRETRSDYPAFGEIVGSVVTRFTSRDEVTNAIRQSSETAVNNPVTSTTFSSAFYHQSEALVLAFEEESNTMVELDYEGYDDNFVVGTDPLFGRRVGIFSSSSNLVDRRDHQSIDDADIAPVEPVLVPAAADVSQNRLFFEKGTDDILSLNYNTGLYVVVIKQRDVGRATGSPGASDLTFMEPITSNSFTAMDTVASDLLLIRVDYAAFPIRNRGR